MADDAHALEFLGQLERSEAGVLSWGLIDGFFLRNGNRATCR